MMIQVVGRNGNAETYEASDWLAEDDGTLLIRNEGTRVAQWHHGEWVHVAVVKEA